MMTMTATQNWVKKGEQDVYEKYHAPDGVVGQGHRVVKVVLWKCSPQELSVSSISAVSPVVLYSQD